MKKADRIDVPRYPRSTNAPCSNTGQSGRIADAGPVPRTVVVMVTDHGFGARAFNGFMTHARQQHWSVRTQKQDRWWQLPKLLNTAKPHGILLQSREPAIIETVMASRIPAIGISASVETSMPLVTLDNLAIGVAAARHLTERAYVNLACLYRRSFWYSRLRLQGFAAAAKAAGLKIHQQDYDEINSDEHGQMVFEKNFVDWALSLPKPLGLFITSHFHTSVGPILRSAGIRIPHDIAILTTGDDPLRCQIDDPPLTSVDIPAEQVGYRAAIALDGLMNGKPFVDGPILLPPTGVTARQSTDAYAIRDEDIVAAAHFIEQNATRGIQIADIVANVPISRRSLQSRFAKAFGRTVAEEILSKKLKHAQFLLMNTDLPLDQVAAQSGLVRAERLCNLFQKHLKTTPRQFRIRNRAQL